MNMNIETCWSHLRQHRPSTCHWALTGLIAAPHVVAATNESFPAVDDRCEICIPPPNTPGVLPQQAYVVQIAPHYLSLIIDYNLWDPSMSTIIGDAPAPALPVFILNPQYSRERRPRAIVAGLKILNPYHPRPPPAKPQQPKNGFSTRRPFATKLAIYGCERPTQYR